MDFSALNNMESWERKKAMFLIETAESLGMDIEGYGGIGVNQNSGYTYLWSEDFPFTLYMPINCELDRNDVYVMFTNYENGDEEEIVLGNRNLKDVYEFYGAQLKEWGIVE